MAVSRSAASQPRAWFPPATFQMRLRGLRSIIYAGKLAYDLKLPNPNINATELQFVAAPIILYQIVLLIVASSSPRKGIYREGHFHITIHENSSDEFNTIWNSDRLEWSVDRQEK